MSPYDSYYRRLQDNWISGHPEKVIPMAEEGLKLYPLQRFEMTFELIQAFIETGSIREAAESEMTINLVSGEKDASLPFHQRLAADLEHSGAGVTLDIIAGAGHWFPEDLAERLAELIPAH